MNRSQRLTFLAIAAVIAVVAIVALAGGSGDDAGDEQASTPAATATPTSTPESEGMAEPEEATPTPTPTPEPLPLLRPGGEPTTVEATQGQRVRFQIRSPVDEEMHLHGYDITRDLPAGRTVTVTIRDPQLTGIYEIELHGSGEQIGSLRVNPA